MSTAIYVLLTGLIFLFFALVWKTDHTLNITLKFILYLMAFYSAWLLIGSSNLISAIF